MPTPTFLFIQTSQRPNQQAKPVRRAGGIRKKSGREAVGVPAQEQRGPF